MKRWNLTWLFIIGGTFLYGVLAMYNRASQLDPHWISYPYEQKLQILDMAQVGSTNSTWLTIMTVVWAGGLVLLFLKKCASS